MKHSQSDSPHEFQMQQEDFPALPRTKSVLKHKLVIKKLFQIYFF